MTLQFKKSHRVKTSQGKYYRAIVTDGKNEAALLKKCKTATEAESYGVTFVSRYNN